MVLKLPADDLAAVGVDHETEEHHPLVAAQIREVREPQLVRPRRREVAVDEIRATNSRRVRFRRAPRLAAALRTNDAVRAHQPLHGAARHLLAGAQQRLHIRRYP